MWRLCEGFFHGESPIPPPPDTHTITINPRRNITQPTKQECGDFQEDLEPVYDPFPTSSEFTLPAAMMTQTFGVFVEQVVLLTVNHRGSLPSKELHSTDETRVWRDPGGSLCLFTTRFRLRMIC